MSSHETDSSRPGAGEHSLGALCACRVLLALALTLLSTRAFAAETPGAAPASQARATQAVVLRPAALTKPQLATENKILNAYGKLPLAFELNQGQTDARVKFLSRGAGYTLFLTGDEAVLKMRGPGARGRRPGKTAPDDAVLRMQLQGSNPNAPASGVDELPGKSNYFIGNHPKNWRTNVPNFGQVKFAAVYPGVDLVYYGNQGELEYDFVVAPGADPKSIKLDVAADSDRRRAMRTSPLQHRDALLRIAPNGELVVKMDGGDVSFHKPVVYQPGPGGTRQFVEGGWAFKNDESKIQDRKSGRTNRSGVSQIGFRVGSYDRTKPLVIDPALGYSTYLGGSSFDQANGIAVDASGNAYVTGFTESSDFPTVKGAFGSAYKGSSDVFVAKLNAAGSALVYSTYVGGSGSDSGQSIALDSSGDAYLTGNTSSTDFPVTSGAFQTACGDCNETTGNPGAFVTKLDPTGSALVYSTYLSGDVTELGFGIAVDTLGNAYVTGKTDSPGFPATGGVFQPSFGGNFDAFVTKLNTAGSALVYSSFLGGNNPDQGTSIQVDAAFEAYVTGFTASANFPFTPGAFQTTCDTACGTDDGFVAKVNTTGSALLYSTYLGGSAGAQGNGIALDAAGDAYVVGITRSSDFPTTPGVLQPACAAGCAGGRSDAFVTKLNPAGSALVYSTYLGGSLNDVGLSVTVDSLGDAYVTGNTVSPDFPVTSGAYRTSCGNNCAFGDAFLAELDPTGSAPLIYSTFLGGSNSDSGQGVALDISNNPYVAGNTYSTDFPVTASAFQTVCGGCSLPADDAFVTKFIPGVAAAPQILNFGTQPIGATTPAQTVTFSNSGTGALTITSITITGADPSDFAQTNTCGASLATGASCTITVTFTPTATGTRIATVSIADDALNAPQTVGLSGAGATGTLTISPSILSFATQAVGTTSPAQNVTLTSNGSLTFSSIVASTPFLQTNTCGTGLASGKSCTISVTFKPTAAGVAIGTLTIMDSATGSPQTVNLSGTGGGVPVATLAPSSTSFGNQAVGIASGVKLLTLSNATGTASLSITSLAVSGTNSSDFTVTSTCGASLPAGLSCTIMAVFKPPVLGNRTGTLTITDNSNGVAGSTQTSSLTGTGTGAEVAFNPAALVFAGANVGASSAASTITLSNPGNASLNITAISIVGADPKEFAIQPATTCSTTKAVAAGGKCTVSLIFTPAAAGTRSATLSITDNGVGESTQTVALSGAGKDFLISAITPTSDSVSPGASASYTLTLTPQDGFNEAVQVTCTGAPSEAVCTTTPATVTLNGSSATNVAVAVTTTAASQAPIVRRAPPLFGPPGARFPSTAVWLALMCLAGIALKLGRRGQSSEKAAVGDRCYRYRVLLGVTALFVILWASCGGGSSSGGGGGQTNPGTPAGTYTLTLSATGGNITQTKTISLSVK